MKRLKNNVDIDLEECDYVNCMLPQGSENLNDNCRGKRNYPNHDIRKKNPCCKFKTLEAREKLYKGKTPFLASPGFHISSNVNPLNYWWKPTKFRPISNLFIQCKVPEVTETASQYFGSWRHHSNGDRLSQYWFNNTAARLKAIDFICFQRNARRWVRVYVGVPTHTWKVHF